MESNKAAVALNGFPPSVSSALVRHAELVQRKWRGNRRHYRALYDAFDTLKLTLSPREQDLFALEYAAKLNTQVKS